LLVSYDERRYEQRTPSKDSNDLHSELICYLIDIDDLLVGKLSDDIYRTDVRYTRIEEELTQMRAVMRDSEMQKLVKQIIEYQREIDRLKKELTIEIDYREDVL